MATLKEIAQKTNVSITTVSRVLNNDKSLSVSDQIRQKILDTARIMQYKTPRNRMRLKSSNELCIGIVHWYDIKQEIEDPYYLQIRTGIEKLAQQSNINTTLIYKQSNEFVFDDRFYDGLILVGKFSDDEITLFKSISSNLVFVDSSPHEHLYDSVVINFENAVTKILDLFIERGYKRIGYIGGVEKIKDNIILGERREIVFRNYLAERNILDVNLIHIGEFSSESGYILMKKALKEKPAEVYFCANDHIAMGAMRAIHEIGLSIPKDIGIFGFNDGVNSEYTYPPLSTLHVPTEFMGRQALISCVELVEGRSLNLKKVVPTNLLIRKSIK